MQTSVGKDIPVDESRSPVSAMPLHKSSSESNSVDLEACSELSLAKQEDTMTATYPQTRTKSRFRRCFSFKPDTKIIYDAVLGLSDGLTVPFALTAGLASVGSTRIVILGGLAELVAGAISMGLGGFVGSKSEAEAYETAVRKCDTLIAQAPHETRDIVNQQFAKYCLRQEDIARLTDGVMESPVSLRNFLLAYHFDVSPPDASRPYISAVTLGMSYFLGGFVALIPYLCVKHDQVYTALWISIGVMAVIMFIFGYVKTAVVRGWRGKENVVASIKGAVQMLVIGALAVGAAVGLVRAVESGHTW